MEFGSQSFFVMPILTASVVISVLTYCSGIFVFDVAAAAIVFLRGNAIYWLVL